MKKHLITIWLLFGLCVFVFALMCISHTLGIALFGAVYFTLVMGLYLLILSVRNPNLDKWLSITDKTRQNRQLGLAFGNAIAVMAIGRATLELPEASLSEMPIWFYSILPIIVAALAFFVRRLTIKGRQQQ